MSEWVLIVTTPDDDCPDGRCPTIAYDVTGPESHAAAVEHAKERYPEGTTHLAWRWNLAEASEAGL